jgi:hypothetical protein
MLTKLVDERRVLAGEIGAMQDVRLLHRNISARQMIEF